MTYEPNMIALLDANVLYPAPIRDLLLSLADAKLFQPKWSAYINEEWTRNLLEKRPDLNLRQLVRTVKAMNAAFPDADVTHYESLISTLHVPDKDDRHVIAAALKGGAIYIITCNLKDFPASGLRPHGIIAIHPDDFIAAIIKKEPIASWDAFTKMVERLQNPQLSFEQVIASLHKCELINTSQLLVQLMNQ